MKEHFRGKEKVDDISKTIVTVVPLGRDPDGEVNVERKCLEDKGLTPLCV